MSRWFYTVETDCADPERTDELRAWYDTVHIPDIFHTESFRTGTRYELHSSNVERGQFLAAYEIEGDDLSAVLEKHWANMRRMEGQGRISTLVKAVSRGIYRQVGEFRKPDAAPPKDGAREYAYVIETACGDPEKHEQFNRWYDEVHVPDLFETEGFVSGNRYRLDSPQEGKAEYLAIYRIVTDDIDGFMQALKENMGKKRALNRFFPELVSVSRTLYTKVCSQANSQTSRDE